MADARLAGMWQPQEYYGAKPGFQLGSWQVDDLRDTRLPLPMSPGAGAVTGPPGWLGTSDLQEFIWSGDLGKLRHPYQLLGAYPPGVRRPGLGPHPLLPNPDSARTEACGTTEAKGGSGGGSSSDKWDSYYRNMEAAARGSFVHGHPSDTGSAGAGSAQSAPSGGRGKEPDDAMAAAMKDADPWGAFSWLGNLYGGYAVDSSDPDDPSTMGHAIANAVLPFFGLGRGFYDCGNRLSGGRWDNYFNTISPATYNRWGTGSIAAGLGIIAGIAFGGVYAGGFILGEGTGGEAAGALGRSLSAKAESLLARFYRYTVPAAAGARSNEIGNYGSKLVTWLRGLDQNYQLLRSANGLIRRKPDMLDAEHLFMGEIKNVADLDYATQLRDLVALAEEHGYAFHLYTRINTVMSGPLMDAIRQGRIVWHNIIPYP